MGSRLPVPVPPQATGMDLSSEFLPKEEGGGETGAEEKVEL